MADIKCRAWVCSFKKHLPVVELRFYKSKLKVVEVWNKGYIAVDAAGVNLEPSTGLKDRSGKEIYKGDIVKNGARVSEVTWHNWLAVYCFDSEPIYKVASINEDCSLPNWEVIGNIHENPELLEKGGEK